MSPSKRIVLGELSANKSTAGQRVRTRKASPETADGHSDSVDIKAVIAKCKELDTKYKDVRKLLDEHRLALRKRSKVIDKWARYADALQRENEQLRARLSSRPLPRDGVSTPMPDEVNAVATAADELINNEHLERPSSSSTPDNEAVSSSPPSVSTQNGELAVSFPRRILSEPLAATLPVDDTFRLNGTASDTETPLAVGDVELPPYSDQPIAADLTTVKLEPSSDPPIIVSTRSVRKRKYGKDELGVAQLQKVKSEHSSSSGPEIVGESHNWSPAESIDFDEEVHVPTPRKRRVLSTLAHEKTFFSSERIAKPRVSLQRPQSVKAISTTDKPHTPPRVVADLNPQSSCALLDDFTESGKANRASTTNSSVGPDVFTSNLALGVKDLAEDGDAEKGDIDSDLLRHPMAKSRLDEMLNSPSIKSRPPLARVDPPRIQSPRPALGRGPESRTNKKTSFMKVRDVTTAPRSANHPVPRQNARVQVSPKANLSRERAPKIASIVRDNMPHGRSLNKRDGALRERPIERLRPEDFKPNPLYNDGLTFVYDEVVRGKDARAALSGCVDPNCCGKTFRRFAQAELDSVGSSVTTRAEDVGLMERYLGDEAFKLGMMTREEREETWLKAKTWELANKFGKHRQRYSRMPSPPGFWSMDFPNTQERAEELRQAEEIRKALVIERHREAMRCNGSWLFRDEESR